MVNENVVPGVAFEPKEMGEETYDHLDERFKELTDARGTMQRSFFHRSMRTVKVVNPETGKKESKREATGWTDTRKYTNARHLAIQRALSPTGRLSGTRREKRKSTLVTVIIINGIDPKAMGQMFADLNGKGITLGASEVAALDIRDPWARATKEIFETLGVQLDISTAGGIAIETKCRTSIHLEHPGQLVGGQFPPGLGDRAKQVCLFGADGGHGNGQCVEGAFHDDHPTRSRFLRGG
jgi:hypothetical protein